MLAKILIIEDDVSSAELVRFQLERAGYRVRMALNGSEGLREAYVWQPEVVLLDVMLPVTSGWTVCERLRQVTDAAIVFLTVLDQDKHVVHGLSLGADDYIVKPFNHRELLARIRAILRRKMPQVIPTGPVYVYDDPGNTVEIDLNRRRVTRDGAAVSLTRLEFKVLACLAEKMGQSCPHSYLLQSVWGLDVSSQNRLKLYIWQLRHKLERDPTDPKIILTDHGVGYRLRDPCQ